MMKSNASNLRILLPAVLVAAAGLPETDAQLALIRQGDDSVGQREVDDWHGAAVALGDFNGDGYDDLATGAPFEKTASEVFSSGSVIISPGSIYGITWEGAYSLSVIDGSLDPAKNSQMGKTLAVGNFNGDEYDDLAVGLPAAEINGQAAAGAVFVYYGSAVGLPGVADVIHQGLLGAAVESGDIFGDALAAGKLGSDQYDDLAVGSPGENTDSGAVIVIRGGAFGLDNSKRQILVGSDFGFADQPGDQFGDALAIGNVTGLPAGDLVIGAPFASITAGVPNSGRVVVTTATDNSVATSGIILSPIDMGDDLFVNGNFGAAFAIGDIWGNGNTMDLAIAAPGAHGGGRVYVGEGTVLGLSWATTLKQPSGWGADDNDDDFGRALATGDHDDDGDDELVAGCPGQDVLFAFNSNSGSVHIYNGDPAGPDTEDSTTYIDLNLGDEVTGEGWLGYAVAMGRTSASPRHSIAAGAPRKHDDIGQVFDIAPWRQVLSPICRSALAADCEGNIVYALRPFDEVKIASTTKIMTVLLGCEATERPLNDPLRVGLNEVYEIEDWMYDAYPPTTGCSAFNYTALPTDVIQEEYTFEALMRTCIMVSGNDSAFAIADAMTGEIDEWISTTGSAPQFVQLMNDRAAVIGMNDTFFTNPAGVDPGDPFSTAYDMWLLAKEAMQNELFRDIVGTTDFVVPKIFAKISGGFETMNTNVSYGWLKDMQCLEPSIVGLKPGGTPGAKSTRVVAAQFGPNPTKLAYATGFRWSMPALNDPACGGSDGLMSFANTRAAQLVQLALSFCNTDVGGPGGVTSPPRDPLPSWNVNDLVFDAYQVNYFDSNSENPDNPSIDPPCSTLRFFPVSEDDDRGSFPVLWQYRALWEIPPGQSAGLEVDGIVGAETKGRVTNDEPRGAPLAQLRYTSTSTGGTEQSISVAAEEDFLLPDWSGPAGPWSVEITNAGNSPIVLSFVGEFTVAVQIPAGEGAFFETCLRSHGVSIRDNHTIREVEPVAGGAKFPVFLQFDAAGAAEFSPGIDITGFTRFVPRGGRQEVELVIDTAFPYRNLPLDAFYGSARVLGSRGLTGPFDEIGVEPITSSSAQRVPADVLIAPDWFFKVQGDSAIPR